MMPQDFPSSGFEQAAGLATVQAFDARTATALARLEREIRELRQRSAGAEAGRYDLTPEVVPALAALTHRVEALTLEPAGHRPPRHPAATRLRTPSPPARLSDANVGRRSVTAESIGQEGRRRQTGDILNDGLR